MDVTIRSARHEDIDTLIGLLAQLFAIETDFKIDADRHRRGLQLLMAGCGKHRCVLVAEAWGRVLVMGTAQLLISTAEGGTVALVEDIVVDASWRGRGLGRKIMTGLERWCRDRGATRLQLLADRNNFPALDFYHHLDWRPTQMGCLRRNIGPNHPG